MQKRCDQFFVVGETYRIEFREERSTNSHKHYFAAINEAWKNLKDEDSDRFPTPDHLRRWALVRAGYADERSIVYDTPEDAARSAVLARSLDGFAIIVPRGNVLKIYTAKSQSMRSMDRATFQASKTAVLNIAADLIGTDPATLAANAQDDQPPREPNPIPASDRDVQRTDNQPEPEREPPAQEPTMPLPQTYAEYLSYLKIWLGFVKSANRIQARIMKEKAEIWPNLKPPITLGQQNQFMAMAADAINKL